MSSAGVKLLRRSLTSLLRRHVTRQEVRYLSRCQVNCGSLCELKTDHRLLSLYRDCRPLSTATHAHVADDKTVIPVFLKAEEYGDKTAVVSQHGHYSYDDLLNYSANLARDIVTYLQNWSGLDPQGQASNREDGLPLAGERIAFLCDNDLSYVVTKWAVWMCGAIAVPLCKSHPTSELQYFVKDSGACLVLSTETYRDKTDTLCKALGLPYKVIQQDSFSGDYDNTVSAWTHEQGTAGSWTMKKTMYTALETNAYKDRKAMIIYTSGTTGRPKGVVHTFRNLDAMMQSMITAWGWTADDIILHVLPLHHVHGVINVLMTSLYCGATCVMLPGFDAQMTWRSLVSHSPPVNVFMAVPTIYAKLIAEYDRQLDSDQPYLPPDLKHIMAQNIRLMVSGSSALPQPIMARWEEITGHTLLERYGMTEIGMALTNPLLSERIPGTVGMPLPGVEVSIVGKTEDNQGTKTLVTANSHKATITPGTEGESGELLVKGDNVFSEYWNKPEETAETFTEDGWFKTGDTAMFIDTAFKIVGRTSVDVIKSGGYKISALDIERHLLSHHDIMDVAVIGLPDDTWGQLVTAVVVTNNNTTLTLDDLRAWCADKMAAYHIPKVLHCLEEMPRNSMGKVNKKTLAKDLFPVYFKQ